MPSFFLLLVQSLAALCFAQCTIVADPKPPAALVCGVQGYPRHLGNDSFFEFTAANKNDCISMCFRNGKCDAFSYDKSSGKCDILLDPLYHDEFRRDPKSTSIYYNDACFSFKGECITSDNPGFQSSVATGGVPSKNHLPFSREAKLAPWGILGRGLPKDPSYAFLATPENMPEGSQLSPSGGNFAVYSPAGSLQPLFGQVYNLEANANYSLSFQYSYIKYIGGTKNNGYSLQGYCEGEDQYAGGEVIDLDSNLVNGTWHKYKTYIEAPKGAGKSDQYGQFCGIYVATPGGTVAKRAFFGFDQIEIKPVPTS